MPNTFGRNAEAAPRPPSPAAKSEAELTKGDVESFVPGFYHGMRSADLKVKEKHLPPANDLPAAH
jgi:hypothetical protein